MQNLPVKKDLGWELEGSFKREDPFCIAFIYPRKRSGFCVKGGQKGVRNWVKQHTSNAVVHYLTYHKPDSISITLRNAIASGLRQEGNNEQADMVMATRPKPHFSCEVILDNKAYRAYLRKRKLRRSEDVGRKRGQNWRLSIFEPEAKDSFKGQELFVKWLRRPMRRWPQELDRFTVAVSQFRCASCPHALNGRGGRYGVTGCKLSARANFGENCPLDHRVDPITPPPEKTDIALPDGTKVPALIVVDSQPDLMPQEEPVMLDVEEQDIDDILGEVFHIEGGEEPL